MIPLRRTILLAAMPALAAISASAASAETCHTDPGGQYGKITICVSSVLAPQAGNSYGPENLIGRSENEGKAWCEGVAGPGVGQSITEKLDGSYVAQSFTITNGYAKSDEAFRGNGRVKRAVIETSRGTKTNVTLKDTREPQRLRFPKGKTAWVKLTITEVYPGGAHADTCVSEFARRG
jgi:hypothetical protein